MSEVAFNFRVEELLKGTDHLTGYTATEEAIHRLLYALDHGQIWLHQVTEEQKRGILACFAVLEHETYNSKERKL